MYGNPTRTELQRKVKRKAHVCILFPLRSMPQHHTLHVTCLDRPTGYVILNVTVSYLNYSIVSWFYFVVPDDRTIEHLYYEYTYRLSSKYWFEPTIKNYFEGLRI